MLIKNSFFQNKITKPNLNKENNYTSLNKGLQSDVFIKSTPSFKGTDDSDFGFFSDFFGEILDIANDTVSDLMLQAKREEEFSAYIEVLCQKNSRRLMFLMKNESTHRFNEMLLRNTDFDGNYFNQLFDNANIKTVMGIDYFIKTLTSNNETRSTFAGQEVEAIKIYGMLNSKDRLRNYPELLLHIFNEEDNSRQPNFDRLNEIPEFLESIGVRKFSEFDEKFAHLKYKFNNFDDISDKVDAIEYLKSTYSEKNALLSELLAKSQNDKNRNPQKVYSTTKDIVDYFYERNDGKSLDGIEEIFTYVLQQDKIKQKTQSQLFDSIDDYKSVENKINLFKFLKNSNVTIDELNDLAGKYVVTDSDIYTIISNKDYLCKYIAENRGTKNNTSGIYYKDFKDVINAIYTYDNEQPDEIKTLIDITERFKIKNSEALLQFYNKATGTNKRNLTQEEVYNFVELFNYSDSTRLFEEAKKYNMSVIELLKIEKEQFMEVEEVISDFIINDKTDFFTGQSALDVYKAHRQTIHENNENIENVLQNIVNFQVSNSEQYAEKAALIKPFKPFFNDKETMMKFFRKMNFKFDSSEEDNKLINDCVKLFSMLSKDSNKENYEKNLNYLINSGFISKSKNQLSEFFKKVPNANVGIEILTLITEKEIPSLQVMENFFQEYSKDNSTGVELFEYLKKLPKDKKFKDVVSILEQTQEKISSTNIPMKISSKNIKYIGTEEIKTVEDLTKLLDKLYGATGSDNFLKIMATSKKSNPPKFTAYKIAQELAFKIGTTTESYKNITRLLGLEKSKLNLPYDCSPYLYTKAIEKALPKEFVDFVNSNDWIKLSDNDKKAPNIMLHAKLRAIDRFALEDARNIQELYTPKTKEKLKKIFKAVFTTQPKTIRGTDKTKRIIADFIHDDNIIEAVFTKQGDMITIVEKRGS